MKLLPSTMNKYKATNEGQKKVSSGLFEESRYSSKANVNIGEEPNNGFDENTLHFLDDILLNVLNDRSDDVIWSSYNDYIETRVKSKIQKTVYCITATKKQKWSVATSIYENLLRTGNYHLGYSLKAYLYSKRKNYRQAIFYWEKALGFCNHDHQYLAVLQNMVNAQLMMSEEPTSGKVVEITSPIVSSPSALYSSPENAA